MRIDTRNVKWPIIQFQCIRISHLQSKTAAKAKRPAELDTRSSSCRLFFFFFVVLYFKPSTFNGVHMSILTRENFASRGMLVTRPHGHRRLHGRHRRQVSKLRQMTLPMHRLKVGRSMPCSMGRSHRDHFLCQCSWFLFLFPSRSSLFVSLGSFFLPLLD